MFEMNFEHTAQLWFKIDSLVDLARLLQWILGRVQIINETHSCNKKTSSHSFLICLLKEHCHWEGKTRYRKEGMDIRLNLSWLRVLRNCAEWEAMRKAFAPLPSILFCMPCLTERESFQGINLCNLKKGFILFYIENGLCQSVYYASSFCWERAKHQV